MRHQLPRFPALREDGEARVVNFFCFSCCRSYTILKRKLYISGFSRLLLRFFFDTKSLSTSCTTTSTSGKAATLHGHRLRSCPSAAVLIIRGRPEPYALRHWRGLRQILTFSVSWDRTSGTSVVPFAGRLRTSQQEICTVFIYLTHLLLPEAFRKHGT